MVMGQLDAAAKAYRAAEVAVQRAEETATARLKAARDARAEARHRLAEAIVDAAREGTRQGDIIRITRHPRGRGRNLLRAGGGEAGQPAGGRIRRTHLKARAGRNGDTRARS